jgi:hypothetical protein
MGRLTPCSHIPTAEEDVLEAFKCKFESCWEYL